MITTKLDANTIQVETTKTINSTTSYRLDFLLKQRASIVAQRDAELAEVDQLIAEATKLGIVE